MLFDKGLDGFHAIQYDCVVHPEPEIVQSATDNYILAIISACPYMPTSLRNFVKMVYICLSLYLYIHDIRNLIVILTTIGC